MKNIKNYILFIFIIIFLILLLAYFNNFLNNNTGENYTEFNLNNLPEGFGIGYYKDIDGTMPINHTEYLQNNEFNGHIKMINGYKTQNNQYLMLALLDYKIVPVYYNGIISAKHLFNLSPMESIIYPYKMANISAGYHDMMILNFKNPDNHSTNISDRLNTYSQMGNVRFNAIVENNNTKPLLNYNNSIKNILIEDNNTSNSFDGLLINKEPFSSNVWLCENVTKNEILNYYINIGNYNSDNKTYAIIQLLDYDQIPITSNDPEYIYYGQIQNNESASIPANLKVPDKKGVYELIVIFVANPYEQLEVNPGVQNSGINTLVESSLRIELNVT